MYSYSKDALDIIAREQGFIRDNLEKVMRLAEIINYFHESPNLSKSLVLKGGTAINLTVFQLPRLSVDIDLDFSIACDRNTDFNSRKYFPEKLFSDPEIVERIQNHPMALWKMGRR